MCAKTSSKSFYHYDGVVCHERWILNLSTISIYSPIQAAQRILISGRLGDYSDRENVLISHNGFSFCRFADKLREWHGLYYNTELMNFSSSILYNSVINLRILRPYLVRLCQIRYVSVDERYIIRKTS